MNIGGGELAVTSCPGVTSMMYSGSSSIPNGTPSSVTPIPAPVCSTS